MRKWKVLAALSLLATVSCSENTGIDILPEEIPEYSDYSTPDSLIANFVIAWNWMDLTEYRDHLLHDGELAAPDGGFYAAFKFYFIVPSDTYGPSWGIEEEKDHTGELFSGNDALNGDPGVKGITLRFVPLSEWTELTEPGDVDGDTYPEGTQFRSYVTDLNIELKGPNGDDFNGYEVNDQIEFYVIPVDIEGATLWRLWKWRDMSSRYSDRITWGDLKGRY